MARSIRTILSLCLILAVLLFNSACLSETADPKKKAYDEDGLLGMSNTNPNLQTSPTYHNYKRDTHLMQSTLKQIKGIKDSRIILNGSKAYITISTSDPLNDKDAAQIKTDALAALSFQVPRYQYILKVEF